MDSEKPSPWPQTPEGVTDWESVFENPKSGFIVLIRSAHSPEILKECATVVVQQLFSRDDDAMITMKFIIELERILPDSNGKKLTEEEVEEMRDAVTGFLRTIKVERLQKAQEYLRRRANNEERRSP